MKKTLILFFWFLATPIALGASAYKAYQIDHRPPVVLSQVPANNPSDGAFYAIDSVPGTVKGLSTSVQTGDARPIIIAEFLEKNDSPLKPYEYYGQFLTDLADKYQLDFKLLPSIMMQESNLCKKIPEGTFNCLGLGIHSQGTWGFQSYEENFQAAAKILREKYLNQGLITPDEIQDKYTPGSNGSWEFAVNHFMDVLETANF